MKRYPTRTCVACRTSRQKRDLVRVVRTPDGRVVLDETGRLAGRGAYLCGDGSCWRQALDKGRLEHALDAPLSLELTQRLRVGADTGGAGADSESLFVRGSTGVGTTNDELNEGEAVGQE